MITINTILLRDKELILGRGKTCTAFTPPLGYPLNKLVEHLQGVQLIVKVPIQCLVPTPRVQGFAIVRPGQKVKYPASVNILARTALGRHGIRFGKPARVPVARPIARNQINRTITAVVVSTHDVVALIIVVLAHVSINDILIGRGPLEGLARILFRQVKQGLLQGL